MQLRFQLLHLTDGAYELKAYLIRQEAPTQSKFLQRSTTGAKLNPWLATKSI